MVLAALSWAGCATTGSGDDTAGGGKGDQGETCTDAEYGDGVCQVALACGIPDIDCFQTFATDADAAAWASGLRGMTTVPESDPLFVRARALTDRAWTAYAAANHLGKLAAMRVAVVVLQNPTLNAFVSGSTDTTKVALAVHFHSAILAPQLTDEEILAVVFHELTHVTKLHVLPEVRDATQRYYVAAAGTEPIGAVQIDDTRVRTHLARWQELARLVGGYARRELGDLPVGGNLDELFAWLLESLQPVCPGQVADVQTVRNQLLAERAPLDGDIVVDAQRAARIKTSLDQLGACGRLNSTMSLSQMFADEPAWPSYLETVLRTEELWLLDDPDALTSLRILAGDRREKMRAEATAFEHDLGAPWTAGRFFSTEEQADDMAVRVSKAQKFAAPGVSLLMRRLLADPALCDAAVAQGAVPYGVRLDDLHHATCWRIAHARQLAAGDDAPARSVSVEAERGPWTPTRPSDGRPMY